MHQVQLNDHLYKEAQRRAREAGFDKVDDFVADRLQSDFSEDPENFDAQFTPEVVAQLDQIADQMRTGKSVRLEEVDQHIADIREAWLKDHAVDAKILPSRQTTPC